MTSRFIFVGNMDYQADSIAGRVRRTCEMIDPVVAQITVVFDDKETLFELIRECHRIGISLHSHSPSGSQVVGPSEYPHDLKWMMFSRISSPGGKGA